MLRWEQTCSNKKKIPMLKTTAHLKKKTNFYPFPPEMLELAQAFSSFFSSVSIIFNLKMAKPELKSPSITTLSLNENCA